MAKQILIRPVITEKATKLADKRRTYSFVVNKGANKIEIKAAVEGMFNVNVESVNTENRNLAVQKRPLCAVRSLLTKRLMLPSIQVKPLTSSVAAKKTKIAESELEGVKTTSAHYL